MEVQAARGIPHVHRNQYHTFYLERVAMDALRRARFRLHKSVPYESSVAAPTAGA